MAKTPEQKRLAWLAHKSRTGHLTKQEQAELGNAYLAPEENKKRTK